MQKVSVQPLVKSPNLVLGQGSREAQNKRRKGQAQAGYDEAKASCVRSRRQGKEALVGEGEAGGEAVKKSARSDLHHMSLTASCPPFLSTHQGCIQCRVSFSEHSISYANAAVDFTAGFIFRTTLEVSIATLLVYLQILTDAFRGSNRCSNVPLLQESIYTSL